MLSVEQRTLHTDSIDGIRPVKDIESQAMTSGFLHGVSHSRDIGVKTSAHVLNIENQSIEASQHFRRGPAPVFLIEAVDGNARRWIRAIGNIGGAGAASNAVFRRQDDHRFYARFDHEIHVAASATIDAGVIGD